MSGTINKTDVFVEEMTGKPIHVVEKNMRAIVDLNLEMLEHLDRIRSLEYSVPEAKIRFDSLGDLASYREKVAEWETEHKAIVSRREACEAEIIRLSSTLHRILKVGDRLAVELRGMKYWLRMGTRTGRATNMPYVYLDDPSDQ